LAKIVFRSKNLMEIESRQQILERRKEIEHNLVAMLKKTKSPFSLEHIKDIIFHEEDNNDMQKIEENSIPLG